MSKTGAFLLLVSALASSQVQPKPKHSVNTPAHKKEVSDIATEDRLRARLQFYPHDEAAHKKLIDLLREKNAFRAIVTEDAKWLSNNPKDSIAVIELISFAEAALNDPELAIAQLRLQLSNVTRQDDPEDVDDWSDQLAARLQRRGRPEDALPLFGELVRLNPNEAGFWADYGDVLSDLGRNEEAAKAFRRAISLDTSMEVFHEGFAEALGKSGDLSGAESEYRAALSLYDAQYKAEEPTDSFHSFMRDMVKVEKKYGAEHSLAETRLKLAHVLFLEKKYDEAIALTQAALEADHNEFIALYFRAEIYDAKGDHEQANKTRETASSLIRKQAGKEALDKKGVDIDPRVIFLQDSLWSERSGHPALPAEVLLILEPRLSSLSPFERIELATAYFALGRAQDGKQQWETAFSADPEINGAGGNFTLGKELLKAEDLENALLHLRRAYELDPQNTTYRIEYETLRERLARNDALTNKK